MSMPDRHVLARDEHGRHHKARRPTWADDEKLVLSKEAVESFNDSNFSMSPRLGFEGVNFNADIALRGEGDIVYHFNGIKRKDFRDILAEVVETHFGSTDAFAIDHVQELNSWALLAKGPRLKPLFNENHFTAGFLELVDAVLSEA